MPNMPMGGGMPSMKDLQQMQQQMPPGMENIDLSKLNFGKK